MGDLGKMLHYGYWPLWRKTTNCYREEFFFSHLNSNQSFAGVEVFGTSYAWV